VVLAAALASVTVLIAAGLVWTARLVHIGNLDAHDLADKLSVPAPVSALDWPELHLNAVVAQPYEQPVVLLTWTGQRIRSGQPPCYWHWTATIGARCPCCRSGAPIRHRFRLRGRTPSS
jgi:hypothetical protein